MSEKRELPKGWIWRKIGEICRSDKRIIPPKSEEWKKLPYVGLANIASDTGKIVDVLPTNKPNCVSFHFSNRHILFSKLRPYLNKVALPNFEGICSTEAIPLMPKPSLANREYLAFFIRRSQVVEELMRDSIGSRQPRARMKKLFDIPVPLPPLAEQERIAGLLARQMTAVEKARKAAEEKLAAARLLPSALLRDAFACGQNETFPASWRWTKLSDICSLAGEYGSNTRAIRFDRVRYVRITDIDDSGNLAEDKKSSPASVEEKYFLQRGDLLFARSGSVGRSYIHNEESGQFQFAGYLIRYRPDEKFAIPRYLFYVTKTRLWFDWIVKQSKTATLANINAKQFSAFTFPLPPLTEQKRIADLLDRQTAAATKAIRAAEGELREIRALPAALLRQAFAGAL